MITRNHFYSYKPDPSPESPPWHCHSLNPHANWYPISRPIADRGSPGPTVILAAGGMPSLGIDPTDPATWAGRGYRQCAGMIGRFNSEIDWRGNPAQLNPLGMGVSQ